MNICYRNCRWGVLWEVARLGLAGFDLSLPVDVESIKKLKGTNADVAPYIRSILRDQPLESKGTSSSRLKAENDAKVSSSPSLRFKVGDQLNARPPGRFWTKKISLSTEPEEWVVQATILRRSWRMNHTAGWWSFQRGFRVLVRNPRLFYFLLSSALRHVSRDDSVQSAFSDCAFRGIFRD